MDLSEINKSVKKLSKAGVSALVKHNAFMMAAAEDNNYDMERFIKQAKKEVEDSDDDDDGKKEEHVFPCNHILISLRGHKIKIFIDINEKHIIFFSVKASDADDYPNQLAHPYIASNYDRLMNDPTFNC